MTRDARQLARDWLKLLAWSIAVGMVVFLLTGMDNQPKGHLVSETYTVSAGDTLDDISYRYMAKSSVHRDVREFREGIVELNWDKFAGRVPGMIYPGDKLLVNYWVAE